MDNKKSNILTSAVAEPAKKSTVYDIAKLAGVSPITVARVFNKRVPVSEATKKRVYKASDILNYKPNLLARGLKGGSTDTLALLWSMYYPMIPDDIFYKFVKTADEKGYFSQLIGILATPQDLCRSLEDCKARGVDGVSICVNQYCIDDDVVSLAKQFDAAVVVAEKELPYDIDQIVWDRTAAIREIVQYFKLTGRQRPAYIADLEGNRDKIRAFFDAASNHKMSVSEDSLIDMPRYSASESGLLLYDYVKAGKFNFDSVICVNDDYAACLMYVLKKCGKRVPDDVAVVGFNNSLFSAVIEPRLATVDRCHSKISEEISRVIFNRLDKPDILAQKSSVKMQFLPRDSAGC